MDTKLGTGFIQRPNVPRLRFDVRLAKEACVVRCLSFAIRRHGVQLRTLLAWFIRIIKRGGDGLSARSSLYAVGACKHCMGGPDHPPLPAYRPTRWSFVQCYANKFRQRDCKSSMCLRTRSCYRKSALRAAAALSWGRSYRVELRTLRRLRRVTETSHCIYSPLDRGE